MTANGRRRGRQILVKPVVFTVQMERRDCEENRETGGRLIDKVRGGWI